MGYRQTQEKRSKLYGNEGAWYLDERCKVHRHFLCVLTIDLQDWQLPKRHCWLQGGPVIAWYHGVFKRHLANGQQQPAAHKSATDCAASTALNSGRCSVMLQHRMCSSRRLLCWRSPLDEHMQPSNKSMHTW